jgi:hypothetical protein
MRDGIHGKSTAIHRPPVSVAPGRNNPEHPSMIPSAISTAVFSCLAFAKQPVIRKAGAKQPAVSRKSADTPE